MALALVVLIVAAAGFMLGPTSLVIGIGWALVAVTFVTTDPDRDTPAALRAYLGHIAPTFRGLSGDLAIITRIAKTVGVEIESTKKLPRGGHEITHGTRRAAIGANHRWGLWWTPRVQIGDMKSERGELVSKS